METAASEIHDLLFLLIRALVTNRDAVQVSAVTAPDEETFFRICVAAGDRGKVIGRQGHTARSLRTILTGLSKERGVRCRLEVVT
jgi:uncharacterized protein